MLKKMIMQSRLALIPCVLLLFLGLMACSQGNDQQGNDQQGNDQYPDIIQGKATKEGAVEFINSVTNQRLVFKPCLNRASGKTKYSKNSKINEDILPCASVSEDAKLIDTETLLIHKYQQPHGSVKCCIEWPAYGIQACYIEQGNVCTYGQPG